jgi:cyclin H
LDFRVACLLLATKSEEMFVKVEDLEKHAGVSAQIILEFELIVLEGIQFHLKIHHPYRALRGFLDQIKKSPGMKDLNDKKKIAFVNQEIKKQSFEYVDHTMFLDLLFFYTPPQIALACLVRSLRELNAKDASFPKDMENLFGIWKLEQFDRNADIERLKGTVEEIISVMFKSYSAFQSVIQNQEHLTALWGKWDKNHNLKNDPNSEE